jgi:hypothetical protein
MVVTEGQAKEAVYRARVAEKIAEKAFDLAIKALTKVEAMEKSTHKAYFVNPAEGIPSQLPSGTPVEDLTPEHPYTPNQVTQAELDQKLDELFDASRGRLDDSVDVFSEGD